MRGFTKFCEAVSSLRKNANIGKPAIFMGMFAISLLREEFTQNLFKELTRTSVNVYGEYGQGQERLVTDVDQLATAAGFIVLSVNMKAWAKDYAGLIQNLGAQLNSQLSTVKIQTKNLAELDDALSKYVEEKTVLLIFNHFDALLDNTELDPQYKNFFIHLNSIRNQSYRVLLAVTTTPFNQYKFYVDEIQKTSPLDLKCLALTRLKRAEIEAFLNDATKKSLGKTGLNTFIKAIQENPRDFAFLEYCLPKLSEDNPQHLSLEQRLARWRHSFENGQKLCVRRKIDKFFNWIFIGFKELWNIVHKLLVVGNLWMKLVGKVKPILGKIWGQK